MTNQQVFAEGGAFRGLSVAAVTPLGPDGAVDYPGMRRHARWLADGGVDVIMPCGTTGEGATLEPEEQRRVIAACLEEVGDEIPVVAGAGTNATNHALALVRAAVEEGAHGILCVTPYYNRPSQEGLHRHFSAVSDAAGGIPVILYNVPGRTGVNMTAETALRLAELEPVVGIKEASGDLSQVMEILRNRPEGFGVLAGDDILALPLTALGGDGVVSVTANEAPGRMAALVRAALEGRMDEARRAHFELLPLFHANFIDTNPVPVKAALELMGRMDARVRLPLAPLAAKHREVLRAALESTGVLEAD
ncbi:MAG: 4-hydroxy-tetrahydrodipicolinate synthase [Gemmatimonadota bacterium]